MGVLCPTTVRASVSNFPFPKVHGSRAGIRVSFPTRGSFFSSINRCNLVTPTERKSRSVYMCAKDDRLRHRAIDVHRSESRRCFLFCARPNHQLTCRRILPLCRISSESRELQKVPPKIHTPKIHTHASSFVCANVSSVSRVRSKALPRAVETTLNSQCQQSSC